MNRTHCHLLPPRPYRLHAAVRLKQPIKWWQDVKGRDRGGGSGGGRVFGRERGGRRGGGGGASESHADQ